MSIKIADVLWSTFTTQEDTLLHQDTKMCFWDTSTLLKTWIRRTYINILAPPIFDSQSQASKIWIWRLIKAQNQCQ